MTQIKTIISSDLPSEVDLDHCFESVTDALYLPENVTQQEYDLVSTMIGRCSHPLPTNYYFLFGSIATDIYHNQEFTDLVEYINKHKQIDATVYEYDATTHPVELLSQADGYRGFAAITLEEYNTLKHLLHA